MPKTGGAPDPIAMRKFTRDVMSKGALRDPATSFRSFMGRDVKIEPFMCSRGFQ
jgi:Zn-dependent oligopeptidase